MTKTERQVLMMDERGFRLLIAAHAATNRRMARRLYALAKYWLDLSAKLHGKSVVVP